MRGPCWIFFVSLTPGIEVIQQWTQAGVHRLQRLVFRISSEAIVSDHLPYGDVVFLFDEAIVVLPVRTPTCEGDTVCAAVRQQCGIDELPAIVTVDSLEREREVMLHSDDSLLNPSMGPIVQRMEACPSRADIGGREGRTIFP